MSKEHTTTPWKNGNKRADERVVISSGGLGLTVAVVHQGAINNAQANAAHIVKCVNMHDELVENLNQAYTVCRAHDYFDSDIEDILKKAGAL